MQSLAVKYRPKSFDEIVNQEYIKKILVKQVETGNIGNAYMLAGPSGTGKTTIARAFASLINKGKGYPIEIDAASHNSVEDVRDIVEGAKLRSLDSEYKVYIIDECHSITTQGWQAFLKTIEEAPEKTVFIFCTTNPEKVPPTIQNRVMRFNLIKIPTSQIKQRLCFICQQEGILDNENCCDYIAKLSNGGMRDAISYLEKVSNYSKNLTMEKTLNVLGSYSYEDFLNLTNYLVDGNESQTIVLLNKLEGSGKDLRSFVDEYLKCILDLVSYCLFNDMSLTKFPLSLEENIRYTVGFKGNKEVFNLVVGELLSLKQYIRYDDNYSLTIRAFFIKLLGDISKLWKSVQ